MEFIPDFSGDIDMQLQGFFLTIHRDEKYTTPHIVDMAVEAENKHGSPEIFSSVAFQNIAGAKTLKEAVQHMTKYLKDEFKVTQDDIVEMLKKAHISETLVVMPFNRDEQPRNHVF